MTADAYCVKQHPTEVTKQDVEVGPQGRVALHGAADRRARESGAHVQVSLTHSRGLAAAVALVE